MTKGSDPVGEFEESIEPGSDEFFSIEPMGSGKTVDEQPTMRETAQRGLGWVIVGTAMLAYLLVVVFYLFDLTDTSEGLGQVMTYVFSGLQTLVAAVIGFYFGSHEKD